MNFNENIINYINEIEKNILLLKNELTQNELTQVISCNILQPYNYFYDQTKSLYDVFEEADKVFSYYTDTIGFPKKGRRIKKNVCIAKIIKYMERTSFSSSYILKIANKLDIKNNITIDQFLKTLG